MKRIVTWIYGIAIALLVTDWGIMGLKIFDIISQSKRISALYALLLFLYAACTGYSATGAVIAERYAGQTETIVPTAGKGIAKTNILGGTHHGMV